MAQPRRSRRQYARAKERIYRIEIDTQSRCAGRSSEIRPHGRWECSITHIHTSVAIDTVDLFRSAHGHTRRTRDGIYPATIAPPLTWMLISQLGTHTLTMLRASQLPSLPLLSGPHDCTPPAACTRSHIRLRDKDIPLTRDERAVLRSQKHIRRAQLGRLANTPNGRRRVVPFLHLVLVHRGGLQGSPNGCDMSAMPFQGPRV